MTVDPLEWLSARNPAPQDSTAPPLDSILARIEHEGARPGRRRIGLPLVPAFAVAATLAVVAAVVVLAAAPLGRTPPRVPPAGRTAPTLPSVPSPGSLMPRGGMPGLLSIAGATSSSPDHAQIDFSQCQPCYRGGDGRGSETYDWRGETSHGGGAREGPRTS